MSKFSRAFCLAESLTEDGSFDPFISAYLSTSSVYSTVYYQNSIGAG